MKKFWDTEKIIKQILEEISITRGDDNLLYITYWRKIAPDISFIEFFKRPVMHGGVTFKRVERCRRKIQEKYPELKDKESADARLEETANYIDYAVNG